MTSLQWANLVLTVVCAGAAIRTFAGNRRWTALMMALVGAGAAVSFALVWYGQSSLNRYFVTLPFGLAVLFLFGRVRQENEQWKAQRAAAEGDGAP